ncbi:hypothetical protein DFH09DRAFT_1439366, partial [Mycena vulgaris]
MTNRDTPGRSVTAASLTSALCSFLLASPVPSLQHPAHLAAQLAALAMHTTSHSRLTTNSRCCRRHWHFPLRSSPRPKRPSSPSSSRSSPPASVYPGHREFHRRADSLLLLVSALAALLFFAVDCMPLVIDHSAPHKISASHCRFSAPPARCHRPRAPPSNRSSFLQNRPRRAGPISSLRRTSRCTR